MLYDYFKLKNENGIKIVFCHDTLIKLNFNIRLTQNLFSFCQNQQLKSKAKVIDAGHPLSFLLYSSSHFFQLLKNLKNDIIKQGMDMDELRQKLLISDRETNNTDTKRGLNRLTLINFKNNDSLLEDSFIQSSSKILKRHRSILQEPQVNWTYEEIHERSMIMEEQSAEQPSDFETVNMVSNVLSSKSGFKKNETGVMNNNERVKKKELNFRIFYMKQSSQRILYNFNLLFNIAFRIGLIVLVIVLSVYGDGDENEEQQKIFVEVVLGLEGFILLFYFLAITKMLYTKSCKISVQFQKEFYQKPYSEIQMERTFRKHFTKKKILFNFTHLLNPFTKFNKKTNINLMRQQIYNRMQLVFVFIPLTISFILGNRWFDQQNVKVKFNIQLLMAVVVCIEAVRCTIHYGFVYIFS